MPRWYLDHHQSVYQNLLAVILLCVAQAALGLMMNQTMVGEEWSVSALLRLAALWLSDLPFCAASCGLLLVNVVLPASYSQSASSRRYPVIILLEGEADLPRIVPVSDKLSRNGLMPESITVAIENIDPFRGRVHDLTPPGLSVSGLNEGSDHFPDFIEKEFLPAVDRQFRGSALCTIIGHSSGGILVTYAATTRTTFRACISIDAPIHLGENWLAKKLTAAANANAAPIRYVSLDARLG
jgi:Putative esterase